MEIQSINHQSYHNLILQQETIQELAKRKWTISHESNGTNKTNMKKLFTQDGEGTELARDIIEIKKAYRLAKIAILKK